jgi:hypothetical protein
MIYVIALVMGYFVGTNLEVEKLAKNVPGAEYSNQFLGVLSSLGGLGGMFCIIPAAVFIGLSDDFGWLPAIGFFTLTFVGATVAAVAQMPGINYLFSAATAIVNIALAVFVYMLALG